MKIINAKDMTEDQWNSYAQFDAELNRKFYPEDADKIKSRQELKKSILSDIELLREDLYEHYVFFEEEKVAGYFGIRLLGEGAEFSADTIYEIIPNSFIKTIIMSAKKYMIENNRSNINSYSRRKEVADALINSGGKITDKKIYSRIMRKDIDVNELRKLEKSLSEKIGYRLELYNTITEEILDRYVEIYNEARIDMNMYNPDNPVIVKRTREDVLKKLRWDKGPEDKMFMYMLFDDQKIAAFCSLFIREENKHMIDQAGGLTTVGRNYRGQNLAKYLKAKIYLKMLDEFPDFEFIRTDTYPWNKYMHRINEEMGFKAYEEYFEMKFNYDDMIG